MTQRDIEVLLLSRMWAAADAAATAEKWQRIKEAFLSRGWPEGDATTAATVASGVNPGGDVVDLGREPGPSSR